MDFFSDFNRCQESVIDSLKLLLYQRHQDIYDRIDFNDDNIFLEPLLYTYITQDNEEWLDSIIYGYETKQKERIIVFTNNRGIIYIPKLGYFHTDKKNQKLYLEQISNHYSIKDEYGNEINFKYGPLIFLENGIELIKTNHPLFENLFLNDKNQIVDVEIDECYDKHISHFNGALDIIKQNYNQYYELIDKSIKKVLIYDGEPYSFATIQAHNMIFLNAHDEDDEIFFLDHILHEGAHVIFNTLTYDTKQDLFTVPFKTNLAQITGDINDHGELYGRFHGMFTQSNINPCMEICIDRQIFNGKQHKELLGRFSSNMKRFGASIEKFDIPKLYNIEGEKWYRFFLIKYKELYKQNHALINSFKVSNQPYVFSYEIFEKTNRNILQGQEGGY